MPSNSGNGGECSSEIGQTEDLNHADSLAFATSSHIASTHMSEPLAGAAKKLPETTAHLVTHVELPRAVPSAAAGAVSNSEVFSPATATTPPPTVPKLNFEAHDNLFPHYPTSYEREASEMLENRKPLAPRRQSSGDRIVMLSDSFSLSDTFTLSASGEPERKECHDSVIEKGGGHLNSASLHASVRAQRSPGPHKDAAMFSGRIGGGLGACGTKEHSIKIEIIEARHLPAHELMQGSQRKPNALACVTLVAKPSLMQHEHFIRIGHTVRGEDLRNLKGSRSWDEWEDDSGSDNSTSLHFSPQEQTHIVKDNSNPNWNTRLHLSKVYPNIKVIEEASAQQQLHALGEERVALDGSATLMMVTVHDAVYHDGAVSDASMHTIGKVLVPFVRTGTSVDQWFVLQDRRGVPLPSHTILPPAVRLRVHYTQGTHAPFFAALGSCLSRC